MTPQRRPPARALMSQAAPRDELAERRRRKQRQQTARDDVGSLPPPGQLKPSPSPGEFWPRADWRRWDDDTQSPA